MINKNFLSAVQRSDCWSYFQGYGEENEESRHSLPVLGRQPEEQTKKPSQLPKPYAQDELRRAANQQTFETFLFGFQQFNNNMLQEKNQESTIQFSEQTIRNRNKCLRGSPNETENLGKHFKSLSMVYLRMIIKAKMLNATQIEAINSFSKKNGSIEAFAQLFQHQQLRNGCLQFYQSNLFVQNILKSSKMQLRTKITAIKYLKRFQKITKSKHWKHFQH